MALRSVWGGVAVAGLLVLPAAGQDRSGVNLDRAASGARGSVAMLAQAQDLYGLGLAQKDAVSVLAAARLAGSVSLRLIGRKKTPEASGLAAPGAGLPLQAAEIFAAARRLAGEDEALIGLIEAAQAEVAFGPMDAARFTPSTLAAGAVDLWEVALFGGSHAEIAVLGDGGSNLDVTVTDENGNAVCVDVGWTDSIYCDFTPAWNGYFAVRVENVGTRDANYHLLTN